MEPEVAGATPTYYFHVKDYIGSIGAVIDAFKTRCRGNTTMWFAHCSFRPGDERRGKAAHGKGVQCLQGAVRAR